MSADDQRAAERLRDVVVCHCYETAGPVGGGHWASCLAEEIGDEVTAVLVDRDRLRAELEHVTGLLAEARTHRGNALDFARERQRELAETRAAGDSLAAIASVMTEDSTTERWDSLGEATHTYWSVRGDAPTAPAADDAADWERLPILDHDHGDLDAGGNCRSPECGYNSDVAAPAIDPTIGEGIRLEDVRDRTARDLGIGEGS